MNSLEIRELSSNEIQSVSGGEAIPPICNNVASCLGLILNVISIGAAIKDVGKGETPPEAKPNWESIGASQQTASAGGGDVGGMGGSGDAFKKDYAVLQACGGNP